MSLRNRFFSYLVLISIAIPTARALDPNCVTQLLTPLVTPLRKSLTSPEERKLIDSWFKDPDRTLEDASRATFDLILRKRLDLLPKELQEKVMEVYSRRTQELTPRQINGYFAPGKNQIGTQNPKNLMGTPIEHSNLLHEIEHAVQHHWISEEEAMRILKGDKIALSFEHEYGAMLAEWQFLSAIPESIRMKMVDEVMSLHIPYGVKDHVYRSFRNAKLPADHYVMEEWRAGRYSWESIEEQASIHAPLGTKRTAFAAATTASLIYISVCLEMKKKGETRSEFFKRVCAPLYLNP